MSNGYGHTNIDDLEDLLPKYGMAELGEARYVREDVGARGIGISHYRLNPGKRARDVVRVAPAAVREFEAGPDGMELLATGVHVEGDGEMLQDWWRD